MEGMAMIIWNKLPRVLIWLGIISFFFAVNYIMIGKYGTLSGKSVEHKSNNNNIQNVSKNEINIKKSVEITKKNHKVEEDKGELSKSQKKNGRRRSKNTKNKQKKIKNPFQLLKLTKDTPKEIIDIMGLPAFNFDKQYKNPCFYGDVNNPLFKDKRLHCLPYFYVIGVKKSGTSDFFKRLSAHPDISKPSFKEAQWFPRIRVGLETHFITQRYDFINTVKKGIDNRSIKFYISMFDSAADGIQKCFKKGNNQDASNKCITAEATPANLHMHTGWQLMPGNEGLTEPRFTNFHYIKHLTPDSKIIIIFRDPVKRLFSDFMHQLKFSSYKDADEEEVTNMFDHEARTLIEGYNKCFAGLSMRRCIYDEQFEQDLPLSSINLAESFRAGFYAFYMTELLSVFRKDQIFVVNMDQYLTNTKETLRNTFKFLKMSALSSSEMSEILEFEVANEAKKHYVMLPKTSEMLYEFYKPYNKKLASILKDNSYLFLKS